MLVQSQPSLTQRTCCAVASPPFPLTLNRLPLFLSRNDIYAGEIKTEKPVPTSVRAPLTLLVPAGKRYEELYKLQEGSSLEVGPFQVGLASPPCIAASALGVGYCTCQRPVRHGASTAFRNVD